MYQKEEWLGLVSSVDDEKELGGEQDWAGESGEDTTGCDSCSPLLLLPPPPPHHQPQQQQFHPLLQKQRQSLSTAAWRLLIHLHFKGGGRWRDGGGRQANLKKSDKTCIYDTKLCFIPH